MCCEFDLRLPLHLHPFQNGVYGCVNVYFLCWGWKITSYVSTQKYLQLKIQPLENSKSAHIFLPHGLPQGGLSWILRRYGSLIYLINKRSDLSIWTESRWRYMWSQFWLTPELTSVSSKKFFKLKSPSLNARRFVDSEFCGTRTIGARMSMFKLIRVPCSCTSWIWKFKHKMVQQIWHCSHKDILILNNWKPWALNECKNNFTNYLWHSDKNLFWFFFVLCTVWHCQIIYIHVKSHHEKLWYVQNGLILHVNCATTNMIYKCISKKASM